MFCIDLYFKNGLFECINSKLRNIFACFSIKSMFTICLKIKNGQFNKKINLDTVFLFLLCFALIYTFKMAYLSAKTAN